MAGRRTFLSVANWDDIQNPRRPKVPPWTKLHRDWLNIYEFSRLSATNRGVLFSMHMLCAELRNRVPYDTAYIAHKINLRPAVVGKALIQLISTEFLVEFAEDLETSQNNDLTQLTGTRWIPPEGDTETDTNPKGTGRQHVESIRERSNSIPKRFKQPKFEELTRACMKAGVRGSDYRAISDIIKETFDLEPSTRQIETLERQINDRRRE